MSVRPVPVQRHEPMLTFCVLLTGWPRAGNRPRPPGYVPAKKGGGGLFNVWPGKGGKYATASPGRRRQSRCNRHYRQGKISWPSSYRQLCQSGAAPPLSNTSHSTWNGLILGQSSRTSPSVSYRFLAG